MERPRLVRAGLALVVVGLLLPAGVAAVTNETASFQRGVVREQPAGNTVVAVQGFRSLGPGMTKKPARLASITPGGEVAWHVQGRTGEAGWFYDVDPLPNDNLLVVAPDRTGTSVHELDPDTRERVWTEEFAARDTHDVAHLGDGELLVAQMRNYDADAGRSDDRLFVYDRETDRVTWEWYFRNHFPNGTDGGMGPDWVHVNDVDDLGDGRFLVSARNFDQVLVVNRSTKAIEMRLGSDGNHSRLFEQHNPDYLVSEDGHPTVLVADSENDRVVEYERRCAGGAHRTAPPADCTWHRTWELTGLRWPRDADRQPDGNTLVTDSLNHRVIEVTPEGRVVWEFYATWGPYDAERPATGRGSTGPTVADLNASGSVAVTGSSGNLPVPREARSPAGLLAEVTAGTPVSELTLEFARKWNHVVPWITPTWMTGWDFLYLVGGVLLAVVWGLAETWLRRDRVVAGALAVGERLAGDRG